MAASSLTNKCIVSLFAVFAFFVHGASDVARVSVFVMKGDSVTLHTNITIKQRDRVKWYFTDTLIAQLNLSHICTDVRCNKGTERFRDRLKLDHQTGDLTITNINTSDAGVYHLKIFSSRNSIGDSFDVVVHEVDAEMKRKSVKEGESVTLDTPEEKTPNNLLMWYFSDTLIAEITADQSKTCKDVQCEERFSDRLKVDLFGSLIITNTRTTDSGDYKLQINSSSGSFSISSIKSFSVTVTDSLAAKAGISIAVILLIAAVSCYFICRYRQSKQKADEKITQSVLYEVIENDEKRPRLHDQRESQKDQCEDTAALFPLK